MDEDMIGAPMLGYMLVVSEEYIAEEHPPHISPSNALG